MKRLNSKGNSSASSSQKRLKKTPIVPISDPVESYKSASALKDTDLAVDIVDLNESKGDDSQIAFHANRGSMASEVPPGLEYQTRELEETALKNGT